jgi:hypothetical protein
MNISPKTVLLCVSVVVVAGVVGAWTGLTAAALAVIAVAGLGVQPATLLALGAALMVGVPFVWLVENASRLDQVSFELVTASPWPSRMALVALVVVAVALTFDLLVSDNHDG